MHSKNSNETGAAWAHGFMALFAGLAMGLGLIASAAQAQPFAYVANENDNTVSLIDTATNAVTATIAVGQFPFAVAVTPDGTRAYVANAVDDTVSVIATATNTVTATIAVDSAPAGIAITPDGTHAYVPNFGANTVSVIDTAANAVTATVARWGRSPQGSPLPRMGRTPMSRMRSPTQFR